MPLDDDDKDMRNVERVGDVARKLLGQIAFRSGNRTLVVRYQRMVEREEKKKER
jgi:hypothetical protein